MGFFLLLPATLIPNSPEMSRNGTRTIFESPIMRICCTNLLRFSFYYLDLLITLVLCKPTDPHIIFSKDFDGFHFVVPPPNTEALFEVKVMCSKQYECVSSNVAQWPLHRIIVISNNPPNYWFLSYQWNSTFHSFVLVLGKFSNRTTNVCNVLHSFVAQLKGDAFSRFSLLTITLCLSISTHRTFVSSPSQYFCIFMSVYSYRCLLLYFFPIARYVVYKLILCFT